MATGVYFLSDDDYFADTGAPVEGKCSRRIRRRSWCSTIRRLAGTRLREGPECPQYELEEADVIVSLDADFLSGGSYPGLPQAGARVCERAARSLRKA